MKNSVRHVRGAYRVRTGAFEPRDYLDELAALEKEWVALGNGERWSAIVLEKNGQPKLPGYGPHSRLWALARTLGKDIRRVALARLGPGGWIKEHRDINGAVLAGMLRFHFPLVTHEGVIFKVDGIEHHLPAGDIWYLDTSYRHAVRNESQVHRVHLIVDFDSNSEAAQLLPAKELRDYVHQAGYLAVCAGKALSLVGTPRVLFNRGRQAYRAIVKRESATL
jgi:hypothetical protein